jgi:GT2 family glycosyltransferase
MFHAKINTFVSVIVPTFNRAEVLEKTIGFLLEQTYSDYEIIIIDQSSCPDIKKIEKKSGIIKYIHIKEKGVPNARNVGIKESKGDIILFLDDDIIPDNDLIFNHVQGYCDKKAGCIAGRVIEEPDVLTNTSIAGCKVALSGRVLRNFNAALSQYTYAALGANMSFLKEAIDKTGFFDAGFIGSSQLEETDYCYRLRKSGYEILYEPEALVKHLLIQTGGCRLNEPFQEIYYRFYNTVLFYAKNKNKWLLPYVFLVHILIAIRKVLIPSRNIWQFIKAVKGLFDGYAGYLKGNKNKTYF